MAKQNENSNQDQSFDNQVIHVDADTVLSNLEDQINENSLLQGNLSGYGKALFVLAGLQIAPALVSLNGSYSDDQGEVPSEEAIAASLNATPSFNGHIEYSIFSAQAPMHVEPAVPVEEVGAVQFGTIDDTEMAVEDEQSQEEESNQPYWFIQY